MMKNSVKCFLTTIPLVMGLAGPAVAALTDAAADSSSVSAGATGPIDSLLNHYSGLIPGDPGNHTTGPQNQAFDQQFSSFTDSSGAMSSYFTTLGVDRTTPNVALAPVAVIGSGSSTGGGSDKVSAQAPATAGIVVAHATRDSLVGAVASAGAPTSSNGTTANSASQSSTPNSDQPLTPTPIPPAAILIGSALVALLPLGKRNQSMLT